MHQFTSVDAQFIAAEDGRVHGHVVGLAIYDDSERDGGRLTTADVRELVASRLHLIPPFRRRTVRVPFDLDLPYWVDDPDFRLEHHIVEHELPSPGGERELAACAADIAATPLDLSRPPWAIHVIRGLAGDRVAIATAIHHAASDGIGMAQMFALLHDPTPRVRDLGGAGGAPPGKLPSRPRMLARGLAGIPRQPVRFVKSFPRAWPHLDQVVTLRTLPGVSDELAPRTRTTGMVSGRRTAAFVTTPLAEIKAIKNHFGVTVNDVVMAVTAGALRDWLADAGDLPNAPLAAMVPISVRDDGAEGAFGNRIAMMIPPVFSNEPDPVARVRRTHDAMRAAKERHRAVPATLLQDANHFIPPVLLARAARTTALYATSPRRKGAAANLLISNIPGSRDPQYLAGARLHAHYPLSAIFHGFGLNVTIVSYGDQVDWGVVADPDQVGDAWPLAEALAGAQRELLAACDRSLVAT
jgi:diacylglycerol O-acyltransferase